MAREPSRQHASNPLHPYDQVMHHHAAARDLPEELALPLASGAEWWYWLGGRPALDLVNTLRERWRRRVETLVTPDDLGLWLVRAQLLPAPPRVTPRRASTRPASCARRSTAACRRRSRASRRPHAAVAVIDGWLAHAGPRPALAVAADGTPVLGERRRRRLRCAAPWARSRSTPRTCSARRPRRRASASAPRRRARRASTTARPRRGGAGARWRCAATRPRLGVTASARGAPPRELALPLGHPRHRRDRRGRVLGAAHGPALARPRAAQRVRAEPGRGRPRLRGRDRRRDDHAGAVGRAHRPHRRAPGHGQRAGRLRRRARGRGARDDLPGAARRAARRRHVRVERDRRVGPRGHGLVRAHRARLRARHPPDGAAARRRAGLADPAEPDRRPGARRGLRRPRRAEPHRRGRLRGAHARPAAGAQPAPGARQAAADPRRPPLAARRRRRAARRAPRPRCSASSSSSCTTRATSAPRPRRPRWACCRSSARSCASSPGGARTARACASRRMRRIAARNTALLAAVGALAAGPGRAALPAAGRRRHLDHELERAGLHRRRRDLRARARGHGDEPAEHPHLGRRRAGAQRLRRARRGHLVDAPPTSCSRSRRWRPSPCCGPLEGEEDDRIAARALRAREIPEPLPVEAT